MGVFDYVNCKYPLPIPGTQDLEYQTKDTDKQWLESYEIREDGTLWTLDRERQWTEDATALLGGYFKTISEQWRQELLTGELSLWGSYGPKVPSGIGAYHVGYSAYFREGQLQQLNVTEHYGPSLTPDGSATSAKQP